MQGRASAHPAPSRLGGAMHAAFAAVTHPRRTAAHGLLRRRDAREAAAPDRAVTRAQGAGHVGHRVAWSDPIDLWRVKRTAQAYRVTVNDVLMAALAGALRARITAAGSEPERLHALVPLNLRPLDEPVPETSATASGSCSPTSRSTSTTRSTGCGRSTAAWTRSSTPTRARSRFGILETMGRAPSAVEQRLIEFFTAEGVDGRHQRHRAAGADRARRDPVAGVLIWAPCSGNMRMTVSLFSYAGGRSRCRADDLGLRLVRPPQAHRHAKLAAPALGDVRDLRRREPARGRCRDGQRSALGAADLSGRGRCRRLRHGLARHCRKRKPHAPATTTTRRTAT